MARMTTSRFTGPDPAAAGTWLAEWSTAVTAQADRAMDFLEQVAQVSAFAISPDGAVTVHVDACGNVVDLALTEAVRRWEPTAIAERILAVMRQAQSGLVDGVRAAADATVGAGSGTARAAIDGFTQRFPAPALERPASRDW